VIVDDGPGDAADAARPTASPICWLALNMLEATPACSSDIPGDRLTFGSQSGWSRNVEAAGGCSIRIDGKDYEATRPERASYRLLGIRQFMLLQVAR
jgi:hypothetical protein